MKYRNVKTDGFDSKKEAGRYRELKMLEQLGIITELETQVRYEVIPKCGKERAAHYLADFRFKQDGKVVVEDVKSKATKTPAYILKRKLLNWLHGIEIKEV